MKQLRLKLYTIDMKYVRNLAKADNNVMSVSPQVNKNIRPFVGILILLDEKKYCIPLSSPKKKFESKKNTVDFIKITHPTIKNEKGANKVIGALNINNMLPIDESLLTPIDMKIHGNDSPQTIAYKELLKDQLAFCQSNKELILKRANKLYDIVENHPDKNINLVKRCCQFAKLERVLSDYLNKK
ncbi:type III toxin-antitoxin system ToxN/AbiQ family toxin [uncultured Ruminococcus sp.]|uniref:type III toxin-antitoxin system ToxN/AbiQ family toxin n=1 Tax=uncultured Ruminococcus sp. TaxID=165186 RepID=UPI0025E58A10|nr:type III toxin-antitoxin system ToxN/AbiQ family toxin [uncultured Ruminococcus sp.]